MLLHEKEAENGNEGDCLNGLKLVEPHPKPPFKCEICDKSFLKYGSFVKHRLSHESRQKYACIMCNKYFKTKPLLKSHLNIHKIEENGNETGGNSHMTEESSHVTGENSLIVSEENSHIVCGENSHIVTEESSHIMAEESSEIVFEENSQIMSEENSHIVSGENSHMTDINFPDARGSSLVKEGNSHVVEENSCNSLDKCHKCNLCDAKFDVPEKLDIHLVKHAEDCPPEPRPSSHKSGRLKHFCSICRKGFVKLDSLRNHFSVHTGELAYECKRCNERFSNSSGLRKHTKTHLRNPYCCKICNRVFKNYRQYKTHSLTHKKNK
ncbi:zinc finger protein [Trichonephila clavata]|uniref:Zinc finger protein n=1 Tax=Trichonephila clavata TaxID=2740835 RepID=A0A8X6HAS3_TRICU|nr:zinc finger protein [Trichonephila clavata]